MKQLKNSAITIMYFYIFILACLEKNIIAATFIILLFCNHIKINHATKNFHKIMHAQREDFINCLKHDLRIQMIAQIRVLELIINENLEKLTETQKDIFFQIHGSCKYILNLMSLMINTYNAENKSYKLIFEKFNISDVIVSCFDELLPQASEKNITFEYDNQNKNINITADKKELKKVILNILSASISGAQSGEKIAVSLSPHNNKIRLSFSCDNKNFFYANIYTNSHYSLIGQSIRINFCKKIIETHHGKIINNNKNNFSFELPQYSFQNIL